MNVPKPLDFHPEVIKKGTEKILRYRELKREIRPLIIIVRNEPVSELEKKIVLEESVNDEELLESDALISGAKKLREDLQPEVERLDKVAKELWEEAIENWEELEKLKDPSLEVTSGRLDIITALKDLIRRQNHAKARRQELIVKHTLEIRDELMEMWKQCMVENSEDAGFPAFHRSDFTQELLQMHKEELEKWKHFLTKHQMLFDQIEKRSNLWLRMRELQVKSEDPNRFINRGGSLLQAQKEQNYVTSALPKCEEKLKVMAKNFEKVNGRKLLIQGMEIPDLIKKDWEEYRKEIKLRATLKHPVTRTSSRPEPLPSGSRTGDRHTAILRENKINSVEKRRARETLANSPSVKKAKSCKNLTEDSVGRRRRSST